LEKQLLSPDQAMPLIKKFSTKVEKNGGKWSKVDNFYLFYTVFDIKVRICPHS
jgi:hypothetical protein